MVSYLLSDRAAHLHGVIVRLAQRTISVLEPPRFGSPLGSAERWDLDLIDAAIGASA